MSPKEMVYFQQGQDEKLHVTDYRLNKPIVPGFSKVLTFASKDFTKNSYIDMAIKAEKKRVPPGTYSPLQDNGFPTNPNAIHFAINKSPKKSDIVEAAERKAKIPAPSAYKPRI